MSKSKVTFMFTFSFKAEFAYFPTRQAMYI